MAGTGIVVQRGWMPDYANGQTLFFLALRISRLSLHLHQFTKARLQPLVDFPQPSKMAAPIIEDRNGTGYKGDTRQDETPAPRPNSRHGQQHSVEPQESDREYSDRASRLPSRSTSARGAYPRAAGNVVPEDSRSARFSAPADGARGEQSSVRHRERQPTPMSGARPSPKLRETLSCIPTGQRDTPLLARDS